MDKQTVEFNSGDMIYIAQINPLAGISSKRYYHAQHWCDSGHQREYIELGIAFKCKEDAERKTKELLGIDVVTRPSVYRHTAEDVVRHFVKDCLNSEGDIDKTGFMWSLTEVEDHINKYFGGTATLKDKPTFTQEMSDKGELPPLGYKTKFYWEFVDGSEFQHLTQDLGWEVNDELEVVKVIKDSAGATTVIVLNTSPDVLNCKRVDCGSFFIRPMTPSDQLVDEIIGVSDSVCNSDYEDSVRKVLSKFNVSLKEKGV